MHAASGDSRFPPAKIVIIYFFPPARVVRNAGRPRSRPRSSQVAGAFTAMSSTDGPIIRECPLPMWLRSWNSTKGPRLISNIVGCEPGRRRCRHAGSIAIRGGRRVLAAALRASVWCNEPSRNRRGIVTIRFDVEGPVALLTIDRPRGSQRTRLRDERCAGHRLGTLPRRRRSVGCDPDRCRRPIFLCRGGFARCW